MKKFSIALIALLIAVSVIGLCSCSSGSANDIGYKTFDEITSDGFYPLWMQPNTYIVYDENGVPEIIEGGELTLKEVSERDDIVAVGFTGDTKIEPNTKAEYDLHGFLQNIYYLWPDGSYNLEPAAQN